ncbi:hypothetical protein LAUMK191_04095 [Mycobacterium attenuatum]|nr:hypothetical protein LAUMK191_04095 [Mycobacterium attenuatum]
MIGITNAPTISSVSYAVNRMNCIDSFDTVTPMEIKRLPAADIAVGYEDGRLVQITIRPTTDDEDGQLGYDELLFAARQIQELARREYRMPAMLRSSRGSAAVEAMVDAYNRGGGKVTDEYLARLAVAYGELAPERRDVSAALADALGKPLQTVKGHIMRARNSGFLTKAIDGKEGGVATPEAREVLTKLG